MVAAVMQTDTLNPRTCPVTSVHSPNCHTVIPAAPPGAKPSWEPTSPRAERLELRGQPERVCSTSSSLHRHHRHHTLTHSGVGGGGGSCASPTGSPLINKLVQSLGFTRQNNFEDSLSSGNIRAGWGGAGGVLQPNRAHARTTIPPFLVLEVQLKGFCGFPNPELSLAPEAAPLHPAAAPECAIIHRKPGHTASDSAAGGEMLHNLFLG